RTQAVVLGRIVPLGATGPPAGCRHLPGGKSRSGQVGQYSPQAGPPRPAADPGAGPRQGASLGGRYATRAGDSSQRRPRSEPGDPGGAWRPRQRAKPLPGNERCVFHDPELAEERAEGRRQGGRNRSLKAATLPPAPPDLPLKTVGDVVTLLSQTINH